MSSAAVRRAIAAPLIQLFGGSEPAEQNTTSAGKRRRRRRAADEDDDNWALVDEIADEIGLEAENELVGTSVADLDRQSELADAQEDDEETESEVPVDETALAAAAAAANSRAEANREEDLRLYRQASTSSVDGGTTLRALRRAKKSKVNYGINAVLDRIDAPLYAADAWLWNRDAAHAVDDEDAQTQQLILALTTGNSRDVPPIRGTRRRHAPPVSLEAVRYERWMHFTTPKLYTTNVVSTFNLGAQVHLFYIINRLAGVCFNPRCFAAAKLRCSKGTHLIFSGGSVVCAGANSVQMSRIASVECTLALTRVGIQAEVKRFTVQNVVSTADAGFPVDLYELAAAYPINAHFDPECFPGLMFRLTTTQLVFIVFSSGKCILTGVATRGDSLKAWRWFHSRILWEFEMKSHVAHETEADYRRRHRQESSMITSMCQSVRDITTAQLAARIEQRAPLMLGAPDGGTHFDAMLALTRRVGHSAAAPIDLEAWLENRVPITELQPTTAVAVKEEPLSDDESSGDIEPETRPTVLWNLFMATTAGNIRIRFSTDAQHADITATADEPCEQTTSFVLAGSVWLPANDIAFVVRTSDDGGVGWVRKFASSDAAVQFLDTPECARCIDDCVLVTLEELLSAYAAKHK